MLGRLPWFAFERRILALRFFVFFDMAAQVNGVPKRIHRSFLPSNDQKLRSELTTIATWWLVSAPTAPMCRTRRCRLIERRSSHCT